MKADNENLKDKVEKSDLPKSTKEALKVLIKENEKQKEKVEK